MELEIKAAKSYQLNTPHNHGVSKIHIDYILDNPADKDNELKNKLVIYRSWSKNRERWFYYADPYYVLAIYNDWKY